MNNITPIRPAAAPAQQSEVQPQHYPPYPMHPIYPTPPPPAWATWPWYSSSECCHPHPPSCWSEIAKLEECFEKTAEFDKFLADAINRLIAQGKINPLPAVGPIQGVTDGSAAGPGMVGELLQSSFSGTVSTGTVSTATFAAITLSPGDWDIYSDLNFGDVSVAAEFFTSVDAYLSIDATRLVDLVVGGSWAVGEGISAIALPARPVPLSVSVPTLIVGGGFSVATPGQFTWVTIARRVR